MKKLFALLMFVVIGTTLAFAQDDASESLSDRSPVTSKWQYLSGNAAYTNHHLNLQEYKGYLLGLEATHGRFFRKSDRLSWQLTLMHYRNMNRSRVAGSGLHNPANTAKISVQFYEADYAVHYNWLFAERLQVRLGGYFGMNAGALLCDDNAVNNAASEELHAQLYASLQLRYGWDLKKMGLDIYANAATPFAGIRTADARYMGLAEQIVGGQLKTSPYKHVVLSSFHNTQGVNWEIGLDFVLNRLTLSVAYGANSRWWSDYEVMNYRKNSFLKLGVSVNLVSLQRGKVSNRQF
jgi:hypothetical protein